MQQLRRVAMVVLVWATASSMLFASTPYYVCRCPGKEAEPNVEPSSEASCCSSNCCVAAPKEKSCCQASKKKTTDSPRKKNTPQNSDGAALNHRSCQKTLVQLEQPLCRSENSAETSGNYIFSMTAVVTDAVELPVVHARRTVWRIDKAPPPDLITVLQHFTI